MRYTDKSKVLLNNEESFVSDFMRSNVVVYIKGLPLFLPVQKRIVWANAKRATVYYRMSRGTERDGKDLMIIFEHKQTNLFE